MEGEIGEKQLQVFFFPLMAHGHTIPCVDMAKLFASRGVKVSVITTPGTAPNFSKSIENARTELGLEIDVKLIKFPTAEAGLPEGCENLDAISNQKNMDLTARFFMATMMLQEPIEQLLQEHKPDCLVADMFFPWATDAAAKFGIPRVVFQVTCFFSLCVTSCLEQYQPHRKNVSSDSEPFLLPNLPDELYFTRNQLPAFLNHDVGDNGLSRLFKAINESESRSYGVLMNTFYELEPAYVDHYRKVLGRRAWHIGPVSLCNRKFVDKALRGKEAAIGEEECLKWLDSKQPDSVIYICFGSLANFTSSKLFEIAMALESSGVNFIWVVRKATKDDGDEEEEDWLPEGFEKRTEGKGLIIRGWAPQVLILDHEAVGGFVTHCGWNSILEGVAAGVPMVTWPVTADHFYLEKMVNEVMKIGVGVGVEKWSVVVGDFVKREAIEKAVREVMIGDKAEEMRSRAKGFAEKAKRAVEIGGSSYSDLTDLIEGLTIKNLN